MAANQPLDQAALDELWDFDRPELSAQRFAAAQRQETDPIRREELATQQARALGLQGRHDEAAALLDTIVASAPVVEVRCLVERGRLHNSAGRPADAVPFFRQAADRAAAEGLTFLTIDALHMVGIAEPSSIAEVTAQALACVDAVDDQRTKRWAVSLHNNLGWALHDAARYDDALAEFEAAHVASRQVGTAGQEFVARWAIARCLRSLGRYQQALDIQMRLATEDPDDEYVVEELDALRSALDTPALRRPASPPRARA